MRPQHPWGKSSCVLRSSPTLEVEVKAKRRKTANLSMFHNP